jgi:isopentenyl-diphosphate Delta-isomerase
MIHEFHDLRGEQKQQLLIVCDKKGKLTGTATREECHAGNGKIHVAFMAYLFDKDGNIILTRRSDKKSLWAKYWDATVVSHVLPGETPEVAANRRGKEEAGVEAEFKNLGAFYYFSKHGASCENEYCYVLTGKTTQDIHPNPVEISQILSVKYSELVKDTKNNPGKYTPWFLLSIKKIKNILK